AMLVSAAVAWVIARLSLRTTGVYFIMITLAFGQMFYYFTISWGTYGGEDGLPIYVRNSFPGLNTLVPLQYLMLCGAALGLALLLQWRLRASPFGLALNAARQSPARAETVGLDPMRIKLWAFVISGTITGLAGALFADLNRFVSPTMFSWQLSGELIILIIIGGVGRLFGPVIGAAVFVTLEHWLGGLTDFWHVWLGVILLFIVLFGRGGIIGFLTGKEGPHV
ncbi:MAG: branched-chain amino acid ABC transporter permease, partial [Litoreibacter sp.]|nr:branched-chain amino acid ABC transporter permease [Litoreibacter sp.]